MSKCPFCETVIAKDSETCSYCGAPTTNSRPPVGLNQEQRVRALLDQLDRIEAIKLYRDETGASLAEAQAAVEAMKAGEKLPVQDETVDVGWEGDVLSLLRHGKQIQAIKLYRERTGGRLKEAIAAVEALGERHGLAVRGSGCMGMLLLAILAAMFVAAASLT
jgi:ribosomal protein L7/L12